MDDRGRIYLDPTEEQVKNKKLIKLDEEDMKHIRKMKEIERKLLYDKKKILQKSKDQWGKNYFNKRDINE